MEDFDLHLVARRSVRGIFALASRTFFIQLLGIAANVILGAYLSEESFGVFLIVSSIVIFLTYFQDIGLAASLIQKKEEPTVTDYRTTFTVQQFLVLGVILPTLFFSRQIADFYNLNQNGYYLFLAVLISLFLSSLRTIPTVILERRLEFNRLIWPQIIENVFYFGALIIFSIQGYGVTTFTIAVLLRSVSGLIVTYIIQPWNIGLAFNRTSFKKLASFGLPFQANSLLALVKDDLLNLYLGKVLPLGQVGYIGFSQKWAFMPLRLVMDNVIKITFPSYSRLQHDRAALKLAIEKSLFLVSLLIFPSAIGLILLSPYFIEYIPKYQKWEPAFASLIFFSLATILSSISTPLTNFLNAIGKVKITLYFMVFWTAATWILTILFIQYFGFTGVAAASFVVSLSSVAVLIVAKRYADFSIVKPILRQLAAAVVMGLFIFSTRILVTNLPLLFLEIALSATFYFSILFLMAKGELLKTIRFVIGTIRSRE